MFPTFVRAIARVFKSQQNTRSEIQMYTNRAVAARAFHFRRGCKKLPLFTPPPPPPSVVRRLGRRTRVYHNIIGARGRAIALGASRRRRAAARDHSFVDRV